MSATMLSFQLDLCNSMKDAGIHTQLYYKLTHPTVFSIVLLSIVDSKSLIMGEKIFNLLNISKCESF